jgi:AraC-like DNA-binding protein
MTLGHVQTTAPMPLRHSRADRARLDTADGRPPCVVLTIRSTDHPERWMAAACAAVNQLSTGQNPGGRPLGDPAVAYLVVLPAAPTHAPREPDCPTTPFRPRTVKRAIDAMQADPARPFTVAELAGVAGVSVRTLQAAFQRHTGAAPMTYLRDLRLGRIHADLLAADASSTTVAQIANRWGWTHLGRFAAAYRTRYGTTPSHTLRSQPPDAPPATAANA